MIDLKDMIIKAVLRKNGYLNKTKYFRGYCDRCGIDKGYQTLSRLRNKPMCVKCATNTKSHREKLKKNHWSKTGCYSPLIPQTDQEKRIKRKDKLQQGRIYGKLYYQKNKERIRKYRKKRLKDNINIKLAANLRSRLNMAINKSYKVGSAVKDLGCSIEHLKKHLESKFQSGMAWENWSCTGWHIDHIKPLVNFDLTMHDQIVLACNYKNLQPLWAKDNLKKGKR